MRYYKLSKPSFSVWLTNFATVVAANGDTLKVTAPQITGLQTLATNFSTAYGAQLAARAAATGATAEADAQWANALEVVSSYNAQFQAIPGISPELLGQLGLNTRTDPRHTIPVYTPIGLTATGLGNGVNDLKWSRNGNEEGATYLVEANFGAGWQIIGTTSRPQFSHVGQQPGRYVQYRVSAQRGSKAPSAPSFPASVYSPTPVLLAEPA